LFQAFFTVRKECRSNRGVAMDCCKAYIDPIRSGKCRNRWLASRHSPLILLTASTIRGGDRREGIALLAFAL
jgi:hypothetical protein